MKHEEKLERAKTRRAIVRRMTDAGQGRKRARRVARAIVRKGLGGLFLRASEE